MSYVQEIKQVLGGNIRVVTRPSQAYLTAYAGTGAYNIFCVEHGAVELLSLGAIVTAAAVGAEEIRITANGVNTDFAAVAINGAVGTVFYSSLNTAGTLIQAAAVPITVATITTMICGGGLAGVPGVIIATFTVGTSATLQFWCAYRALSPNASVEVSA